MSKLMKENETEKMEPFTILQKIFVGLLLAVICVLLFVGIRNTYNPPSLKIEKATVEDIKDFTNVLPVAIVYDFVCSDLVKENQASGHIADINMKTSDIKETDGNHYELYITYTYPDTDNVTVYDKAVKCDIDRWEDQFNVCMTSYRMVNGEIDTTSTSNPIYKTIQVYDKAGNLRYIN